MGFITDQVLLGKETIGSYQLDVSGGARISSLAGTSKMVVADSSGVLSTQSILDASGIGYVGFFGDGADGDVSVSTSISLTREMSYNNLTVTGTGNITTNGYIIRVRRNLVINSGGVINCDGKNGSGNTAGTGAYSSTVYPEFGVPSDGGTGGVASSAGSIAQSGAAGGTYVIINTNSPIQFRVGSGGGGGGQINNDSGALAQGGRTVWMLAGSGGAGKDANWVSGTVQLNGGGGGGGAGVCCVYAYSINNAGVIRANGGNGGNGAVSGSNSAGGGGGGGGGVVIVYYRTTSGSGVGTLQANGGTAGTGGVDSGSNNGSSGVTMSCRI